MQEKAAKIEAPNGAKDLLTAWNEMKLAMPRYAADFAFAESVEALKPLKNVKEFTFARLGREQAGEFLSKLPIPEAWHKELEPFLLKEGYGTAFKAAAIIDLFGFAPRYPDALLKTSPILFDMQYRENFQLARLWGYVCKSGTFHEPIDAEGLKPFNCRIHALSALFFNPSETYTGDRALVMRIPELETASGAARISSETGHSSIYDAILTFRLVNNVCEILKISFPEFEALQESQRDQYGSWRSVLLLALARHLDDLVPKVNGKLEGSSAASLSIKYQPPGKELELIEVAPIRKRSDLFFTNDKQFEERLGKWKSLEYELFDGEIRIQCPDALRLARIVDRSVVVRAGFAINGDTPLPEPLNFTSNLRKVAIPVPAVVLEPYRVTQHEVETCKRLVSAFGYTIVPELLSPHFVWLSKGDATLEPMASWRDVLNTRSPGIHLLHVHLKELNRHPGWCLVWHDDSGAPKQTVWIGHKGGGLGFFDPALVSIREGEIWDEFKKPNFIRSPMYARAKDTRWDGVEDSRRVWGGMGISEAMETLDISYALTTMLEDAFKDGIQRIPLPIDAVAIESIPFWGKESGLVHWTDWRTFSVAFLKLEPVQLASNSPAVFRSISKCGLRIAGLINGIFSRSEQSAQNPDICKQEIDGALQFLYFQFGESLRLPQDGVSIRHGQLGPAEVACYLAKVSALNSTASARIYRAAAHRILSTVGFVHGTKGDMGGSIVPEKASGAGGGGACAIRNVDILGMLHDLSSVTIGNHPLELCEAEARLKRHLDHQRCQRADIMHVHHTLYWLRMLCHGEEVSPGTRMETVQRGYHNYLTYFGAPPEVLSDENLALSQVGKEDSEGGLQFAARALGDGWELEQYRSAYAKGETADSSRCSRTIIENAVASLELAVESLMPVAVKEKVLKNAAAQSNP